MDRIAIVEAPSPLGAGDPRGVERLAGRLLELGLAEAIGARLAGRVTPPPGSDTIDLGTHVRNATELAAYMPALADAVGGILEAGDFPLILGGDCSILLGSGLALKRRGRFGLLFIDGNADFFQPEAVPDGEAASMELGFVTGHGPALLADLEGLGPLFMEEDVVAFGWRDHEDQAEFRSQALPATIHSLDLPAIRKVGLEAATLNAIGRITRNETKGFFLHLDADVLDEAVMPAVNYPMPGGLSPEELTFVLRQALGSGQCRGMEVAIYNPALDADGSAGRTLTDILVEAFTD